ncbi:MAG: LamG domain-containing protein, partial [Candidatus Woesearchaeota archaeon]
MSKKLFYSIRMLHFSENELLRSLVLVMFFLFSASFLLFTQVSIVYGYDCSTNGASCQNDRYGVPYFDNNYYRTTIAAISCPSGSISRFATGICTNGNCVHNYVCDNTGHGINLYGDAYRCQGTAPSGENIIRNSAFNTGYVSGSSGSARWWTYESTGALGTCGWRCASGFIRSGNTCIEEVLEEVPACFDPATSQPLPLSETLGVDADGLVGYWPFRDNAQDVFGNNNGNLVNNMELSSAGIFDGGYFFDGSSYIYAEHSSALDFGTEDFSACLWVNLQETLTYPQQLLMKRVPGGGNFEIQTIFNDGSMPDNSLVLILSDGSQTVLVHSPDGLQLNSWNHICAVRKNGYAKMYLNSVLGENRSASFNVNSGGDFVFGYDTHQTDIPEFFNGIMEDVSVFNRALTECEVKQLALGPNACNELCEEIPACSSDIPSGPGVWTHAGDAVLPNQAWSFSPHYDGPVFDGPIPSQSSCVWGCNTGYVYDASLNQCVLHVCPQTFAEACDDPIFGLEGISYFSSEGSFCYSGTVDSEYSESVPEGVLTWSRDGNVLGSFMESGDVYATGSVVQLSTCSLLNNVYSDESGLWGAGDHVCSVCGEFGSEIIAPTSRTLTCEATPMDYDGDVPTLSYEWFRVTSSGDLTPVGSGSELIVDVSELEQEVFVCRAVAFDGEDYSLVREQSFTLAPDKTYVPFGQIEVTLTRLGRYIGVNQIPRESFVSVRENIPYGAEVICHFGECGELDANAIFALAHLFPLQDFNFSRDVFLGDTSKRGFARFRVDSLSLFSTDVSSDFSVNTYRIESIPDYTLVSDGETPGFVPGRISSDTQMYLDLEVTIYYKDGAFFVTNSDFIYDDSVANISVRSTIVLTTNRGTFEFDVTGNTNFMFEIPFVSCSSTCYRYNFGNGPYPRVISLNANLDSSIIGDLFEDSNLQDLARDLENSLDITLISRAARSLVFDPSYDICTLDFIDLDAPIFATIQYQDGSFGSIHEGDLDMNFAGYPEGFDFETFENMVEIESTTLTNYFNQEVIGARLRITNAFDYNTFTDLFSELPSTSTQLLIVGTLTQGDAEPVTGQIPLTIQHDCGDSSCMYMYEGGGNRHYYWKDLNTGSIDLVEKCVSFEAVPLGDIYDVTSSSSGIVGYWNFDSDDSSTAYDDSFFQNHGLYYGESANYLARTIDSCKFNSCALIPGRDPNVDNHNNQQTGILAPYASAYEVSDFTLSAWVRPNQAVGIEPVISFGGKYAGAGAMIHLHHNQHNFVPSIRDIDGYTLCDYGCSNTDVVFRSPRDSAKYGEWQHIALTRELDNFSLYVDGSLIMSVVDSNVGNINDGSGFGIGRRPRASSQVLNGSVDDVAFFDIALSSCEIELIATGKNSCGEIKGQSVSVSRIVPHSEISVSGGSDLTFRNRDSNGVCTTTSSISTSTCYIVQNNGVFTVNLAVNGNTISYLPIRIESHCAVDSCSIQDSRYSANDGFRKKILNGSSFDV